MLNFVMRGHDLEGDSVAKLAKKCKQYGLYGMQLAMAKSLKDFKQGCFSPALAQRLKEELGEIKIPVLGSYINPSATDKAVLEAELKKFCEQLKFAHFIGAHMVGTETGYVGDCCVSANNNTEHAYEYFLSNMAYLVEIAEKLGVMIGIEGVNCFVVNNPRKMRRALDDLNSPNVLAIFDPVNYLNPENYINQDKMIDDAFELFGEEMSVLHLKDFKIDEEGKFVHTLPTEGILNTKKILTYIKQRKPDMPIVLEGVTEKDVKRVMKNVQALYDEIEIEQ